MKRRGLSLPGGEQRLDDATKPNVGRIPVEEAVPRLVHGDHRRLQGNFDESHRPVAHTNVGKVTRDGCDQM